MDATRRGNRLSLEKVLLGALLLGCYVYTLPRWADPNQNSRLDMVFAVVEDGTFQIDKYVQNTVDYAKVGEHYYSDKAPGAAFLGIPTYAVLRVVLNSSLMDSAMGYLENSATLQSTLREDGTGLLEHKVRFASAQVVLTFVASMVPTAFLGIMMYGVLEQFIARPWLRVLVVLGYGLCTPAFPYAGAFYGHQLCAFCLFAAFYIAYSRMWNLSTPALFVMGLLLGYSVITEYPSVLIVGVLCLYAFFRLPSKWRVCWVVLGGAVVAAGWLLYNTAVFGAPLELGYSHSELWVEQHHTGFMSLTRPSLIALWGVSLSPFRGLFYYSPLLLLAIPGFVLWYRSGEHRIEFWVTLSSVLAMFLFNSSSIMWWGGFAVGPRYLLPMLPFLVLPLAFVLRAWSARLWFRMLVLGLTVWSWIAVWGLTLAGQAFPPDAIKNPLIEYAWPQWQSGNIARNLGMFVRLPGLSSLIPLLVFVVAMLVALAHLSRQQRQRDLGGV